MPKQWSTDAITDWRRYGVTVAGKKKIFFFVSTLNLERSYHILSALIETFAKVSCCFSNIVGKIRKHKDDPSSDLLYLNF